MAPRKSRKSPTSDPQTTPDTYDVGYRKPPREHRFKPGTSGNRKGRPRRSVKLAGVLGKALQEQRTVTVDGRKTKMTNLEVIVRRMMEKATSGDIRAFSAIMELLAQHTPELLAELQSRTLGAGDAELLKNFFARNASKAIVLRKQET